MTEAEVSQSKARVAIAIRIPPDLHARLVGAAQGQRTSLNAFVLAAVERWVAQHEKGKP